MYIMKAWENFLKLQEIELGKETVTKWLAPLKITRFDACNLYLESVDSFQVLWFEEHIRPKIKTRLLNSNNKQIKVHLSVCNQKIKEQTSQNNNRGESAPPPFKISFDTIDPSCKFENFIVNEGNELAVKVLAETVGYCLENRTYEKVKSSDLLFNPIYIFGEVGTGKTHLLMTASHAMRRQGLNVIYARAETFTEHVVTAIRAGEMSTFRQAYRNVDALIIDDVHIFSRKGATQEELFHTFNTLHLLRKPIILSANCKPNDLAHVEPRLISRFEWGISLELKPHTKQQTQDILQRKAESLKFSLRPAIAEYLAETFHSTTYAIRSLEALILRSHLLKKTVDFSPTTLTIPMVKNTLKDLILDEEQKALTPQKIIKLVAEYYGITTENILGKSQTRDCAVPRKMAMYLVREKLGMPFIKIGDIFQRDHSTVMTSINDIKKLLEKKDETMSSIYNAIHKSLQNE